MTDAFAARLRAFLLSARSSGHAVTGEWHLVDADSMIPNFRVTIEPVGEPLDASERDPAAFTTALQDFLLEEFAAGTQVVGRWTVETLPEADRAWVVVVERDGSDGAPDDRLPSDVKD